MLEMRRGLRVLQLIYQDPLGYPPTMNAAHVLRAAGADVRCLGFRRGSRQPGSAASPWIHYVATVSPHPSLREKMGNLLRLRSAVAQEIRSFRPDLLVAYDHWGGWGVLPLVPAKDSKVVLHLHDLVQPGVGRFSSDGWMWREVLRKIDLFDEVIVPEPQRAEALRDVWSARRRIEVMANAPMHERPVSNQALRNLLLHNTGRVPGNIAVSMGNMGLYVETVQALSRARSTWDLVVVGCGHEPSVRNMIAAAEANGVSERLHIFPYTPYDVVREWLRGADAGLAFYPSASTNINWQTMGRSSVKVNEYMAAALPSVVCSKKSFSHWAAETGALLLLREETAEGIASALDILAVNADRQRYSAAAARAHETAYNMEAQLEPMIRRLRLADG